MNPVNAALALAPAAVVMFAALMILWALTPRRPDRRELPDRRTEFPTARPVADRRASTSPGAVVLVEPVRATLFAVVCTEDDCSHESGGATLIDALTADKRHWTERHALRKAVQR